ncbi:MAG: dihydrofolate reductase [Cellulosilyticum sp.]|nr:dihydrofolate reductase [Cellulosilyticum sp.]
MIKLIAAISQNNQIGLANQMPWHIPEDLEYFKQVTSGHTILMGRKTFESIGRILPNRRNIILTRDSNFIVSGADVIHSIEKALELCKGLDEVFIIGGGEIYSQFLPYADMLYLTLIEKYIEGDTSFPHFKDSFKCIQTTPGQTTDGTVFAFTIWNRK